MNDSETSVDHAHVVFAGLVPTPATGTARNELTRPRLPKGVMATVPIVLASAMAMSLNIATPAHANETTPKRPAKPKTEQSRTFRDVLSQAAASVKTAAAPAPVSYTVKAGDTVSSIASRYGLSTASVLALNGLGWKSLIFPGQALKLSAGATVTPTPAPAPSTGGRYTIQKGDTISRIAAKFGVSTQSVLTANGLSWSSIIYPGQTIAIPGSSLSIETVSSVTPIATTPPAADPAPPAATTPPADPAPTPAPAPAPAPASTNYVIVAGDTVSSIAAKFGVSVQAILTANGLNLSSIIYSGRTLTIPVASIPGLTAEQTGNARLIVQVGRGLGVPDRGIIIALAAAMQESSLRNISFGDRDSLGLFQQRPSTGWGTREQILDPVRASMAFYGGPSNPNKGKTRGLLDIAGWQSMTLTQAAQKVQISAYPDAYAKWESGATTWFSLLG